MTWSYIARANGSNSGTFTPASWPTGTQDGDIVIFASMVAPDGGSYEYTCTTTGWTKSNTPTFGQTTRFMWARYSAAQALPTLTAGASTTTNTWSLLTFRPTQQSAFAVQYGVDSVGGSAPVASSYTTTANSTLLVLYASVPGDTGASWTATGGFTQIFQTNGSGSGDANYPNQWCGWQAVSSPSTAVTNMRAYLVVNRYYIFGFGEGSPPLFFMPV